ncbi:MAG: hypothetical protein A2233_00025 [Candidatus Kerfeldbacteria bacterium RIFOXYA2_FULL_38_24]|uniref:Fibronectin type-III domain-containing protein n=1 Tax=Candidatus Kerfeldbacteria bacterium RIFOXYB2_FULL_38_14 TaxID=1798547 RepID=A0A1G2B9Z0_9BACT|nr:MAG: hypothetical protein A2233_00025 [Candidatus Kerfeldbacteria bacterium RIFOXYA2_FULL_38_24]OGY85981.1 MAG: hypothetical protein A2319_00230 [Candidatus Kerfeldbacteria bacterium RIFOXYB2_FULL_38_14]
MQKYVVIFLFFLGLFLALPATAAEITVNSPEYPGSGDCDDGTCTLAEAITKANGSVGADSIIFNIDSGVYPSYYDDGQFTITITSALSSITGPLTINASANWDGINARPGIKLYSASTSFDAFNFSSGASNSVISGLEIQGFSDALEINATSVTVGTNCNGVADGQEVNVLYGGVRGIYVTAANFIISGNIIGLNADGDTYDGYSSESIYVNGASADNGLIGFTEGSSCSAVLQKNVIAGSRGASAAVYVRGTGFTNWSGLSSAGPDHIIIAGNYLGTDITGTEDRSGKQDGGTGTGSGVYLYRSTTECFVGTDGDGVDDALEKNVINAALIGINIDQTGTNRVAGNYVGVTAGGNAIIGNSLAVGAIVRGIDNYVGYCTDADHATLCFAGGTLEDQRNIFGGAQLDGARFGALADGSYYYGNYFGVGSDNSSDVGNLVTGFFISRQSDGNIFGGAGNKANIVKYNGIGVQINGEYSGNRVTGDGQIPITNTVISGNTISNNDGAGVQAYLTEVFDDSSVTVSNNIINNNGATGIDIQGSSPAITDNTINNNTTYGIQITPGFIKRNVDGWNSNEPLLSYDIDDAATNLVALPNITGNTLSGNTEGGIYELDAAAVNNDTLFTDNTIENNNDQFAIAQAWYGAIEILNGDNEVLDSAFWDTVTANLMPAIATSALQTNTSDAVNSDVIFGNNGLDYHDVRTWLQITDYEIASNGTRTDYNPYTLTVDGTAYSRQNGSTWTFDGVDNDSVYAGVLASGVTSTDLYRFQIAKVSSSATPGIPVNLSPLNNAEDVSLTAVLSTSDFIDTFESHTSSLWQIYNSSSACNGSEDGNIYSAASATALNSLTVPADVLSYNATYYWKVSYTNSFGNTSDYSSCFAFTTLASTPVLLSAIPDQSFNEDETLVNAFDLDDYFENPRHSALYYSAVSVADEVTVTIEGETSEVSLAAESNWNGITTVSFVACNTENECGESNEVTVTVQAINDVPQAPVDGFSPSEDETIAGLTPTIVWDAGSDTEDASENLTYELWLSSSAELSDDNSTKFVTSTGETSVAIVSALVDNTSYYYQVRTIDSEQAESSWSTIQTFQVQLGAVPNISLTKTVAVVKSDLTSNYSASVSGGTSYHDLSGLFSAFSGVSGGVVLLSFLALLMVQKRNKIKGVLAVLGRKPAMAFAEVIDRDSSGNYTDSYSGFYKKVVPLSRLFQISGAVTLIFLVSHLTVQAKSNQDSLVIAPGDVIKYTLSYENTGDASAGQAVLQDNLSADVLYLTDSFKTNRPDVSLSAHTNNRLTISLGTIKNGEKGNISYQVKLNNPATDDVVHSGKADLTYADLSKDSTVSSNAVAVKVKFGNTHIYVADEHNQPLSEVSVLLYQDQATAENLLVNSGTNDQGEVLISGLRAGQYFISIDGGALYQVISAKEFDIAYQQTTALYFMLVTKNSEQVSTLVKSEKTVDTDLTNSFINSDNANNVVSDFNNNNNSAVNSAAVENINNNTTSENTNDSKSKRGYIIYFYGLGFFLMALLLLLAIFIRRQKRKNH